MTVIYVALGICVLLTAVSLILVLAEFKRSGRMIAALKKEWDTAESQFGSLASEAHEKISKLAVSSRSPVSGAALNSETRSGILTMARKGLSAAEIARKCGVLEGEIEVLLGLGSLQ